MKNTNSLMMARGQSVRMGVLGLALAWLVNAGSAAEFANFTQTLPGGEVKFEMIAIPAGEITVGSPENEPGRGPSDLAPQKVAIKRFWIGKCEVTWAEFLPYVFIDKSEEATALDRHSIIDKDGLTHPSKPLGPAARGHADKKNCPALGMSASAAMHYTKWLSKKTGRHYRLPTEEEWEYACRAGATTAFFWGNDPAQAVNYAWYTNNAAENTHPVGKLKPNSFGLYDMAGNVGEWCLPKQKAPGVLRGGNWSADANALRCAARMVETEDWNDLDPNDPKSQWWLSSADFTGFRVVCDEAEPTEPETAALPLNSAKPNSPNLGSDVKSLYVALCQNCHGAIGKGDTKVGKLHGARDYTTAEVKATFQEERWVKAILEGLEKDGKRVMNSFRDKITQDQAKALAAFMKAM
jgi:formylglycine-generating enzyme required for sulfatase activity/cytochrome c553